jgi:Na+-translocating ferredoxin:NAD+ oxidoreductase subunit E
VSFASYLSIAGRGLWRRNPGLVELLGLCPLLGASTTLANGLGLGLATTLVLALSGATAACAGPRVSEEIRLPLFVLTGAVLVTIVQLGLNAYWHALHVALGIFVPLIATNCLLLARAQNFARTHSVRESVVDGLASGLGLCAALITLGALREVAAKGTLGIGIEMLFGPGTKSWAIHVLPKAYSFPLAASPVGAFLGLALLIAARNALSGRARHLPAE